MYFKSKCPLITFFVGSFNLALLPLVTEDLNLKSLVFEIWLYSFANKKPSLLEYLVFIVKFELSERFKNNGWS